jgi:acetyl-CoA carboxylase biotin carboxyl carrier protein
METDTNIVVGKVTEVIKFMGESNLSEIELETNDFKMKLKKHGKVVQQVIETVAPTAAPVAAPMQVTNLPKAAPAAAPVEENNYQKISSPMAGTFYAASSPTAEPYVKEGDSVAQGQTLCIVEAMKMMNEIKANISGKIVKILSTNGSPVEKGQNLFYIE